MTKRTLVICATHTEAAMLFDAMAMAGVASFSVAADTI